MKKRRRKIWNRREERYEEEKRDTKRKNRIWKMKKL